MNFERLVQTAVASTRRADGSVDPVAAAQAFLDQVRDHERLTRLEEGQRELAAIQGRMSNPALPVPSVTPAVSAAKERLQYWDNQHAAVLQAETEQYKKAMAVFIAGASLAAAGPSGGMSLATIVPLFTSLFSSLGIDPTQA